MQVVIGMIREAYWTHRFSLEKSETIISKERKSTQLMNKFLSALIWFNLTIYSFAENLNFLINLLSIFYLILIHCTILENFNLFISLLVKQWPCMSDYHFRYLIYLYTASYAGKLSFNFVNADIRLRTKINKMQIVDEKLRLFLFLAEKQTVKLLE